MKTVLLATAAVLALSGGAALAAGGEGGSSSANSTATSMGAPSGSPEYSAPRSAAVPGLPAQERAAQQNNAAAGQQTDQGVAAPVKGPSNPVTGNTQVAH